MTDSITLDMSSYTDEQKQLVEQARKWVGALTMRFCCIPNLGVQSREEYDRLNSSNKLVVNSRLADLIRCDLLDLIAKKQLTHGKAQPLFEVNELPPEIKKRWEILAQQKGVELGKEAYLTREQRKEVAKDQIADLVKVFQLDS